MAQTFASKDGNSIIVSVFPAAKGLQSGIVSAFAEPESCILTDNMIHPTSGARTTRPGLFRYMSNDTPLGGSGGIRFLLDHFRTVSGVKEQKVIAVANKTIYANSVGGPFVPVGTFSNSNDVDIVTGDGFVGLALLGIKGNGMYSYNHTALSQIATAPSGAYIVRKHRGSVWVAGNPDSPETLYKSNTEDPTDYSTGTSDAFNIDLGASDRTGLLAICPEYLGRLYLGKYSSLYEIDTSVASFPVRPISDTIGIISHNGVIATPGDLIFPSARGLHSMKATQQYGDIADTFLSRPVEDIWLSRIDFTRHEEISAAFAQEYNSYLMVYPEKVTGNYNLLGLNLLTGNIYHWDDFGTTYVTRHIDPDDGRQRTLHGREDGDIAHQSYMEDALYTDFNSSYTSSFTTPPIFPMGVPGPDFRFTRCTFFFNPRSVKDISITYQIDGDVSRTASIIQSDLTLGGRMVKKTVELAGVGQSVSFTFSCSSSVTSEGAAMELLGYNINCVPSVDKFNAVQLGT